MPRFKLNPEAGMVFVPGHGRVKPGDILMGEQYRRFTPNLLVEVPDPPPAPPMETRVVKPKPKPLEAPKPVTKMPLEAEEPVTSPDRKLLTEDDPPPAKPTTKKRLTRRKR
jgi:hypothetical protein